ncbi:hypothetical protein ACFQY7_18180 [Actinomadura luteofluorescens]|uniref:hypothetical protein n=1 Tax=Actinomadura luteofluorescens TaxID=46163 RepID=UPI003630ACD1
MRIFDGRGVLEATHARIADDRIDAVGDASVQGADDVLVDGRGGTLLPGLIDAHVHLLPGCTQLAAVFGVTTLIDQFSKPEVIEPERAAVGAAARGSGPVRADLCTSSVGATAPGGHPTMAYEPLPYVTGPRTRLPSSRRVWKRARHTSRSSSTTGRVPCWTSRRWTPRPLRRWYAARTSTGCPWSRTPRRPPARSRWPGTVWTCLRTRRSNMSDDQVTAVASAGCALIATLSVVDGSPGPDGGMPLLVAPAG